MTHQEQREYVFIRAMALYGKPVMTVPQTLSRSEARDIAHTWAAYVLAQMGGDPWVHRDKVAAVATKMFDDWRNLGIIALSGA